MNKTYEIIPSIASGNMLMLGQTIEELKGFNRLHLDIEDGNFVPNITFGIKTIQAISSVATQLLDVHILAYHPERYIDQLSECGVSNVAVHFETLKYPMEVLHQIHCMGMKAGLALNIATPVELIEPFVEKLDYILIMTSEPDGEGQIFCPSVLKKIKKAKKFVGKEIWVDGGIGEKELNLVEEAGADKIIMGRGIFCK